MRISSSLRFHFDFLLCLLRYVGGIMGDDDSSLSERVESVAAVLGGALEQGELGTRRRDLGLAT